MNVLPYNYEKMLQEAYQQLWRQWSEAHQRDTSRRTSSLMRLLTGKRALFPLTLSSCLKAVQGRSAREQRTMRRET